LRAAVDQSPSGSRSASLRWPHELPAARAGQITGRRAPHGRGTASCTPMLALASSAARDWSIVLCWDGDLATQLSLAGDEACSQSTAWNPPALEPRFRATPPPDAQDMWGTLVLPSGQVRGQPVAGLLLSPPPPPKQSPGATTPVGASQATPRRNSRCCPPTRSPRRKRVPRRAGSGAGGSPGDGGSRRAPRIEPRVRYRANEPRASVW
jgi:hypothetical protein